MWVAGSTSIDHHPAPTGSTVRALLHFEPGSRGSSWGEAFRCPSERAEEIGIPSAPPQILLWLALAAAHTVAADLRDWTPGNRTCPRYRGNPSLLQRHGVKRLRVFGSVLADHFDPDTSDIDFLVAFQPKRENLFHDYFDLKFELERIVGREVDLAWSAR